MRFRVVLLVLLALAVSAVQPVDDGVDVTVENLRWGVMPVELRLTGSDGAEETVIWPASVWAGTRAVTKTIPFVGTVDEVVIDPDQWYPDIDRSNNSWIRPTS